jgi:hypothetical protein
MISTKDLRAIARARVRDAEVLLAAKRYDGAFYICGYAVELLLKARIYSDLDSRKPEEDLQVVGSHRPKPLKILLALGKTSPSERSGVLFKDVAGERSARRP